MLDILDILLRGNEVQVSTSEGGRMGILIHYLCGGGFIRASLVAQVVKNPPAMQETWVRSLGWEDTLEKGKATHSKYSGLENSMDYIVHGVAKSWTRLSDFHFILMSFTGWVLIQDL